MDGSVQHDGYERKGNVYSVDRGSAAPPGSLES